jgi:hypothetical protein
MGRQTTQTNFNNKGPLFIAYHSTLHQSTVMPALQFDISTVTTRTELAQLLNVDLKALDLVVLSSTSCASPNCCLPAVVNNRDRCVLCSQTWFPKNGRGSGLYGVQFMPVYNGKRMKNSCCCNMELCGRIGYDHQGMMSLPKGRENCIAALNALAVNPAKHQEIVDSRKNYRVAHWHYSPLHRIKDQSSGKWMLRKFSTLEGGEYMDGNEKKWGFPPPNHSLQQYIEDEINGFGWLTGRGGHDDSLPQWVQMAVDFKKASESNLQNHTTSHETNSGISSRHANNASRLANASNSSHNGVTRGAPKNKVYYTYLSQYEDVCSLVTEVNDEIDRIFREAFSKMKEDIIRFQEMQNNNADGVGAASLPESKTVPSRKRKAP